jgi:hypothetical protein
MLVKAVGYWPSFHDAEVLKVTPMSDSCTVSIHVFEMTDQVDSAGYLALRYHHLIELYMPGVQANSLPSTQGRFGSFRNQSGIRRSVY